MPPQQSVRDRDNDSPPGNREIHLVWADRRTQREVARYQLRNAIVLRVQAGPFDLQQKKINGLLSASNVGLRVLNQRRLRDDFGDSKTAN